VLTSLTPPERRRRLLYAFVLVGVIALGSVALGTASETALRRAGFGGNPIWMARLLCAAALIVLFGMRWSLIVRLPLAGILIVASIFTGSRGPLLVTGLVIVLALLMRASLARDRESAGASLVLLAMLAVGAGLGLGGLRVVAEQQAATNARSPFVRIFYGGESAQSSSEARVDLYETSLAVFGERPMLGAGLGGLAGEFELSDNIYSHNLLLEIASETGLLGLVIHLVTVLLTVLLVIRYLHSPDTAVRQDLEIGLLMLIFCYANAQLSGDLVGNKMVWFFLGFINGALPAWGAASFNARVAVHRRKPQTHSRAARSDAGKQQV